MSCFRSLCATAGKDQKMQQQDMMRAFGFFECILAYFTVRTKLAIKAYGEARD